MLFLGCRPTFFLRCRLSSFLATSEGISEDSDTVASRGNSEVRRTAYRKDRLLRRGGSDLTGRSNSEDGMVGSDGVAALASNIGVDSHSSHLPNSRSTTQYLLLLVPCSDILNLL